MKSRHSHDTPARISYTDGGTKTVTFPEVNRGDLKNLSVDGEQIMTTHDIAVETEKLSRQIRLIAVLASTIAVVVLVLVSLIYQYEDGQFVILEKTLHSRQKIANRLYEVSGNIWVRDQWIVDPSWQQNGNSHSGLSEIGE